MSRLARPLQPLTLSVAMAFAAVPLLTVQASYAAESAAFSIPAGDLSQALNSLAEQAGLVLAFDSSLTRGKHSNGLNGQYNTDAALAQVLAGSGLQALKIADDRYRLEAIPHTDGAMELQATTISGAYPSESPTGPVSGYVATRSLSGTKTDTA
ncbi:MAG: secretin and TonB N-terminal domain-containing protein, partial [Pseudomonas sp.]